MKLETSRDIEFLPLLGPNERLLIGERLLEMANWFEENGFSPQLRMHDSKKTCGCFLSAWPGSGTGFFPYIYDPLVLVIGSNISEHGLRSAGWKESAQATRDAIAACEIAASIVLESGPLPELPT